MYRKLACVATCTNPPLYLNITLACVTTTYAHTYTYINYTRLTQVSSLLLVSRPPYATDQPKTRQRCKASVGSHLQHVSFDQSRTLIYNPRPSSWNMGWTRDKAYCFLSEVVSFGKRWGIQGTLWWYTNNMIKKKEKGNVVIVGISNAYVANGFRKA